MVALRPSEAGRWAHCPASPHLQEPIPEIEGEDAKEGHAAHWVAAQVLGRHCGLDQLVNREAPNGIIITNEMIEHVEMYVNTVGVKPCVIEREQISAIPNVENGTPDALRVEGSHGEIFDFKYGWRLVEVFGNLQLAIYAINLFAKHEWTLDTVTVWIVQPRPWHVDGRARSWTIDRQTAWTFYQYLTDRAQVAQNPESHAVTGPHCRHCRALLPCEAARIATINAVDVSLEPTSLDLPNDVIAAELETLRRAADMIKLRLDAMEEHAINLIDNGKVVPGWSIDRAYGRETWKDPNKVKTVEMLTGLTLHEEKPLSPAQARKAGADKTLVKSFTTTPVTGRKLVNRDVSVKARQVFK